MTPLPSKKNVWPLTRMYGIGLDETIPVTCMYVNYMIDLIRHGRACELLRGDIERRLALEVSKHGG